MVSSKRGLFITIEGIEGVGKSTNIEFVRNHLIQYGISPLVTREPGGTVIAEEIRKLLLADHGEKLNADAELLLVFAARAQHLNQLIKPALESGDTVLCDRFTDATYAYQGAGRNLSFERISELEQWVQGSLRPDLTVLLDVPVEVGMSRISGRGELDRFEREQQAFFKRVRQCYLQRADSEPERYLVIDAGQELKKVQRAIGEALDARLKVPE